MKIEDFVNMPPRAVIATFYMLHAEDHVVEGKEDLWMPFVPAGEQPTMALVDQVVLAALQQVASAKKTRYIQTTRQNLYSVDVAITNPLCIVTRETDPYTNFIEEFKRNEAPLGLGERTYDSVVYVPEHPVDIRRELTLLDPEHQILSCRFLETIET